MCFSETADLAAGVALLPIAALSLREVRHPREVPFAALPLLFSAHQFTESFVWRGLSGDVSHGTQQTAALIYLLFALPVLPTYVPVAVTMLEPHGARRRVAPFIALGVVVSAFLLYGVLRSPITVTEHSHALTYGTGVPYGDVLAVFYVTAVIGPAVLSGYRSIIAFGTLNLVGLVVVAVLLTDAFASVWCIYAALASALVLVHLYRRRRLPDPHRLRGVPLAQCA